MKKFSVFKNKWNEVSLLMNRHHNPYTVLEENEKYVSVSTPISKTEMHIVCDLAACRVQQKEKAQDPDHIPLIPYSLATSERYKKKYMNGVASYRMSVADYDRMEAAGF